MPYKIRKQGNRYCVFNKDTGKTVPGGCHPTEGEAKKHMKALYANVDDADEKKEEGGKIQKAVHSQNGSDDQKAAAKRAIDYHWKGR